MCSSAAKKQKRRSPAAMLPTPSSPPSCQFGNLGSRLSTLVLRIVTFSLLPFPPGVRTNNRPGGWKPGKATHELQQKGQREQRRSGFTVPASTCVCLRVYGCASCSPRRRQQAGCGEVCGNCIESAAAVPVFGNAPPLLREDTGITLAEGLPCSGCKVTGKETKCA